jgi:glycopeptide antibiotics resistance protein
MVEFAANILLFVPLGVLVAALLGGRRQWWAVPIGAMLSGLIEVAQLLFLPSRVPDGRDVLANTLGTVIGAVIVWSLSGARSVPSQPADSLGS